MKKYLFISLLLVVSLVVSAQDAKFGYCELVGTGSLFSTKVKVEVDYGQETSFWNQYDAKILKDENGKAIKFNSMVDAMNYMGDRGWEFVQAYVVSDRGQNVYHWILKRKL